MRLSSRARYGLRAMIAIAMKRGVQASGAVLARETGISKKYLDAILHQLRTAGLINASHGARGGYSLARAADEVTAADIVETLEKEIALVPCVEDPGTCKRSSNCPTLPVWRAATEAIRSVLGGIKLSDLARDNDDKEPMYHI